MLCRQRHAQLLLFVIAVFFCLNRPVSAQAVFVSNGHSYRITFEAVVNDINSVVAATASVNISSNNTSRSAKVNGTTVTAEGVTPVTFTGANTNAGAGDGLTRFIELSATASPKLRAQTSTTISVQGSPFFRFRVDALDPVSSDFSIDVVLKSYGYHYAFVDLEEDGATGNALYSDFYGSASASRNTVGTTISGTESVVYEPADIVQACHIVNSVLTTRHI